MQCYPNQSNSSNIVIKKDYKTLNQPLSLPELYPDNIDSSISFKFEINENSSSKLIALLYCLLILNSLNKNALEYAVQELTNIKKLDEINYPQYRQTNNHISKNFLITKQRLLQLNQPEPDFYDEDEINTPSDYAFSTADKILNETYNVLGDKFPLGFSILDSRGGINLIWRNQQFDKEVKIKISAHAHLESYVYYYQVDDSELKTINPDNCLEYIVNILNWLSNSQPINCF